MEQGAMCYIGKLWKATLIWSLLCTFKVHTQTFYHIVKVRLPITITIQYNVQGWPLYQFPLFLAAS